MLEAIQICEELTGHPFQYTLVDDNRRGDHIWWISDTSRFKQDYPDWIQAYNIQRTLAEIIDSMKTRWSAK
jgi:CDP-paratose 2-epimerase